MPEFPRHHSERTPTTAQPRALRKDADVRDEARHRTRAAVSGIAEITDATLKWNAAVEKIQADTARHNFKLGIHEISNQAVQDTDITAEPIYQKKIQDLRKQVTDGLGNPSLAKRMGAELDYMANMGSLGIQSTFRKKTIIHGQKVKMDELNMIAQNPTENSAVEIKAVIADAVKAGYWDEVQGYKYEQRYLAQMRQNMFIQDLNEDPAQAQKNMLKNTYGFTIEELNDAGKIFERELKVIQNQTEIEGMQMKLDGTLTEDWLRDQMKIKKLGAKAGIAMIKDLNTIVAPKATALDKTAEFNRLVAMRTALKKKENVFLGFGDASFDERTEYRAAVFDAHRKGLITDSEMENDFLTEEISNKFMRDPKFNNAMEAIYDTSEQYMSREDKAIAKAQMSKELVRKVMDGMNPTDALDLVIREKIAADFPGVDPVDLMYTAKKRGVKVWQVYKLLKPKGEE